MSRSITSSAHTLIFHVITPRVPHIRGPSASLICREGGRGLERTGRDASCSGNGKGGGRRRLFPLTHLVNHIQLRALQPCVLYFISPDFCWQMRAVLLCSPFVSLWMLHQSASTLNLLYKLASPMAPPHIHAILSVHGHSTLCGPARKGMALSCQLTWASELSLFKTYSARLTLSQSSLLWMFHIVTCLNAEEHTLPHCLHQ